MCVRVCGGIEKRLDERRTFHLARKGPMQAPKVRNRIDLEWLQANSTKSTVPICSEMGDVSRVKARGPVEWGGDHLTYGEWKCLGSRIAKSCSAVDVSEIYPHYLLCVAYHPYPPFSRALVMVRVSSGRLCMYDIVSTSRKETLRFDVHATQCAPVKTSGVFAAERLDFGRHLGTGLDWTGLGS